MERRRRRRRRAERGLANTQTALAERIMGGKARASLLLRFFFVCDTFWRLQERTRQPPLTAGPAPPQASGSFSSLIAFRVTPVMSRAQPTA